MITLLLASALALPAPAASPAANPAADAMRCAAASAVLADILESGTATPADRETALVLREQAARWRARAAQGGGTASVVGFERQRSALAAQVLASDGPEAANRLLDRALDGCAEPSDGDPLADLSAS